MFFESCINNVNFATTVLPKRKVAGSELYSNIETHKDSASRSTVAGSAKCSHR